MPFYYFFKIYRSAVVVSAPSVIPFRGCDKQFRDEQLAILKVHISETPVICHVDGTQEEEGLFSVLIFGPNSL